MIQVNNILLYFLLGLIIFLLYSCKDDDFKDCPSRTSLVAFISKETEDFFPEDFLSDTSTTLHFISSQGKRA